MENACFAVFIVVIPVDMRRSRILSRSILRTQSYSILLCIGILRCRRSFLFSILIVHDKTVTREYVLISINIFCSIPILNDPILECQRRICFRRLSCRTCDSLSLIRVFICISRCISSYDCIACAVLSCSSVLYIDAICALKNPAPACIKIDLTNSPRIVVFDLIF